MRRSAWTLMLMLPAALGAQTPACTYQACALRTEPSGGFFARTIVLRGWPGEEVSRADRSPELEALLSRDDSAAHHYALFAGEDRRADRLERAGMLLYLAGFGGMLLVDDDDALAVGASLVTLTGAVLGVIGTRSARDAVRSLSRALWWHNASLPGGVSAPPPGG